ncbi:hypothetical protein KRE40_09220 [Elizabethkingia meningoseptica]|uniref:hypothetical protein n=1 Tax=Elizabethkingia meningoseptica TaxID=238 RepID=UPI0023B0F978|nr:hypothetical protein [Elizabethkingia meningoseptica]MDE5438286.1 hypothetical protein [Elizabethkingia meningoseptica]MDE5508829.1 hypothetical protein [Elizabethkingia meningoseptica]MDE5515712.1 hypothetical protein [Elizabethkingia meningoseptica]MDE5527212.1 hypothetical protein [Elizabethkingia meningoseptica]MDE5533789.1 hypothetical protein [Elizabethkingia meningoseptica]
MYSSIQNTFNNEVVQYLKFCYFCREEYNFENLMHSKKFNIILLVFLLGFFLIPGQFYAGILPVKEISCCTASQNKQQHQDNCEKDCCSNSKAGTDHCKDKCGSQLCQNCLYNFHIILSTAKSNQSPFSSENVKLYSLYKQPYYSSAHLSIWSPPKIG